MDDFNQSIACFSSAFNIFNDPKIFNYGKYPYIDFFNYMIRAYVDVGQRQKALDLYKDFLSRQIYDKDCSRAQIKRK